MKNKTLLGRLLGSCLVAISAVAVTVSALAWFVRPGAKTEDHSDGVIGLRGYFYSGTGEKGSPFEIVSPRHLYNLSRLQNLGIFTSKTYFRVGHYDPDSKETFCLDNDGNIKKVEPYNELVLDMTDFCHGGDENSHTDDNPIAPIGTEETPFIGEFQGHGIPIKGLIIEGNPEDIGVFGYVSYEGKVEGMVLNDVEIRCLGYSDESNVKALFGQNVDDIFNAQAGTLSAETSFKMYNPSELDLKVTTERNLNASGGTVISSLNHNLDANGNYTLAYFIPSFPLDDSRFTYSWKSSSPLITSTTLSNGVETGIERIVMNLKEFPFDSTTGVKVDTRLSLLASVEEGGYTYSRVIQSYCFEFSLGPAKLYKLKSGRTAKEEVFDWNKWTLQTLGNQNVAGDYYDFISSKTDYASGDVVVYDSEFYIATVDNPKKQETPTDGWSKIGSYSCKSKYGGEDEPIYAYMGDVNCKILCDYIKENDSAATNYHHGTNIGFLAGHVDGTFINSYVYKGTFFLNDNTTNNRVSSESDTGLIGEIGNNVDNTLDPDYMLSKDGDTGVINFSRLYDGIRFDMSANDDIHAGKNGSSYYAMYDGYVKDGTNTYLDERTDTITSQRGDYYDLYEPYLRYYYDQSNPNKQYITNIDEPEQWAGVNGGNRPGNSRSNHKLKPSDVKKGIRYNSIEFLENNVIEDYDSLGVFKIVTAKNANSIKTFAFPSVPARDTDVWAEVKAYDASKYYVIGDHVVMSDKLYRCVSSTNRETWGSDGSNNHWVEALANNYSSRVKYSVGNIVRHDGKMFICISPIGSDGATLNKEHWVKIERFSSDKLYVKGDLVFDGTNVYRCIVSLEQKGGFDEAFWTKVNSSTLPAYNANSTYAIDDIVKITENEDGISVTNAYICSTTINTENWNPDHWAEVEPYVGGESYSSSTTVSYENKIYRSSEDVSGDDVPGVSSKWVKISDDCSDDYSNKGGTQGIYSVRDVVSRNGKHYMTANQSSYSNYQYSNLGKSQIVNGRKKSKVYFSTAENVYKTYNNTTGEWQNVPNNKEWGTGNNQILPLRATTIPTYSDSSTFNYPFSRDYNYCFELDLSHINQTGGYNYMWNTKSDFLRNYLSTILIDKAGRPIKPLTKQFGFMFRSDENKTLEYLSSYMSVANPTGKEDFGNGRYYPSNSIVFDIDNPNGANVSVVGNNNDISIYTYDPYHSGGDISKISTMRAVNGENNINGTYANMTSADNKGIDFHRFFTYNVSSGYTSDVYKDTWNYSTTQSYFVGDIVFYYPDAKYVSKVYSSGWYVCKEDTSGVWDPTKWDPIPDHSSRAAYPKGTYLTRNGRLFQATSDVPAYTSDTGGFDAYVDKFERVDSQLHDENALYAHIFKLPKGHYVIGAADNTKKANIYFLAVQGQKKGTILTDDLPSGFTDNVVKNVDFLLKEPTYTDYQTDINASDENSNAMNRAFFSFQINFSDLNYQSKFKVHTVADGGKNFIKLEFSKSPAFVTYLYLHSRGSENTGILKYYINDDPPSTASDLVYTNLS